MVKEKIKVGLCWVSGGQWRWAWVGKRDEPRWERRFAEIELRVFGFCFRGVFLMRKKYTMASPHAICPGGVTHQWG